SQSSAAGRRRSAPPRRATSRRASAWPLPSRFRACVNRYSGMTVRRASAWPLPSRFRGLLGIVFALPFPGRGPGHQEQKPAQVGEGGHGEGRDQRVRAVVLRIDFPGCRQDRLRESPWDEFFRKSEGRKLAFVYQDKTPAGRLSRFHKLVSREQTRRKRERPAGPSDRLSCGGQPVLPVTGS